MDRRNRDPKVHLSASAAAEELSRNLSLALMAAQQSNNGNGSSSSASVSSNIINNNNINNNETGGRGQVVSTSSVPSASMGVAGLSRRATSNGSSGARANTSPNAVSSLSVPSSVPATGTTTSSSDSNSEESGGDPASSRSSSVSPSQQGDQSTNGKPKKDRSKVRSINIGCPVFCLI